MSYKNLIAFFLASMLLLGAAQSSAYAQSGTGMNTDHDQQESNEGDVEGVIVYGKKGRLKDAVVNSDGSISLPSTSVYKIWDALSASQGIPVNLDFTFAPTSTVLTADGDLQISLLAGAIAYVGSSATFDLQVHSNHKASQRLSTDRINAIVHQLNQRYGLRNQFSISRFRSQQVTVADKAANRAESLRVTIVNTSE